MVMLIIITLYIPASFLSQFKKNEVKLVHMCMSSEEKLNKYAMWTSLFMK